MLHYVHVKMAPLIVAPIMLSPQLAAYEQIVDYNSTIQKAHQVP